MKRVVLITALFFMALGAFSLHMRIHPVFVTPRQETSQVAAAQTESQAKFDWKHFLASFFAFFDLLVVTWLFTSNKTVAYAFLFNGMLAIFGAILMGHLTVAQLWGTGASLADWIYLKSTLADIIILAADFLLGKAIYDSYTVS